jgi:DNA-binding transcriptional regulator LsrR (DeoR family)
MNTVMLAGGMAKLDATRAILRAGFIKKLLVDEALARALVAASHQGRA